jgi:hypothetical protein
MATHPGFQGNHAPQRLPVKNPRLAQARTRIATNLKLIGMRSCTGNSGCEPGLTINMAKVFGALLSIAQYSCGFSDKNI